MPCVRVGRSIPCCFKTAWTKCGKSLSVTFNEEHGFFSWQLGRPNSETTGTCTYDASDLKKIEGLLRDLNGTIKHPGFLDEAIEFVFSNINLVMAEEIRQRLDKEAKRREREEATRYLVVEATRAAAAAV